MELMARSFSPSRVSPKKRLKRKCHFQKSQRLVRIMASAIRSLILLLLVSHPWNRFVGNARYTPALPAVSASCRVSSKSSSSSQTSCLLQKALQPWSAQDGCLLRCFQIPHQMILPTSFLSATESVGTSRRHISWSPQSQKCTTCRPLQTVDQCCG